VYRGVNPDKLGTPAFNVAYDADSFNQVYYKLRYLERHGVRFRRLVMGVDYFQFGVFSDARNSVYGQYLGPEYLRDYATAATIGERLREALHPIDEDAFDAYMLTDIELTSYQPAVVTAFEAWLREQSNEFGARYLNYSTHADFALSDFADTTHLTEAGADKCSALLGRDLLGGDAP